MSAAKSAHHNRQTRPCRRRCPETGKARYRSRKQAAKELDRQLAFYGPRSEEVVVGMYACWHCGGFHLTSSPGGRKQV